MTEIQGLTGTAFIVAECRARENAEANPLYVDRIVPLFLDERTGGGGRFFGGFSGRRKDGQA